MLHVAVVRVISLQCLQKLVYYIMESFRFLVSSSEWMFKLLFVKNSCFVNYQDRLFIDPLRKGTLDRMHNYFVKQFYLRLISDWLNFVLPVQQDKIAFHLSSVFLEKIIINQSSTKLVIFRNSNLRRINLQVMELNLRLACLNFLRIESWVELHHLWVTVISER